MTLDYKKFWAALIAIDGIGRITFRRCLKYLQKHELSPNEFWVNKYHIWQKIHFTKKQVESIRKFQKVHTINSYWEELKSKAVSVLTFKDKNYPQLLSLLDDKPVLLFVKGKQLFNWNELPVAVVGSRRVTDYGAEVTKKIVKDLASYGANIVSGFMYGVDLLAHRTALKYGARTIGVLGFGFDHMYPLSQRTLFDQLLQKGMVFVSEYAPHVAASAGQFPVRNRIIAGMSFGTIVTQAAAKSGSFITAHCAAEYGREVFAIPGPISNGFCDGTRALINEGAQLVANGREVMEALQASGWVKEYQRRVVAWPGVGGMQQNHSKQFEQNFSQEEQRILALLSKQVLSTNELAEQTTWPISKVKVLLSRLELLGMVEQKQLQWRQKI